MTYYISPESYETAKANGISEINVYHRVYSLGWTVERAITEPVRKSEAFTSDWLAVALKNGISRDRFRNRVRYLGWGEERAAITPVLTPHEVGKLGAAATPKVSRYFTDEQRERLKKMGIAEATARQRIDLYGWSVEEATTKPLGSRKRRKRYANTSD